MAELDLSNAPSGGDVWAGMGFYGGNDDFTVYTLDGFGRHTARRSCA